VQSSKNSSAAPGRLSIHCTVVIAIIGLEQGSATDTANSLLRMMHQVLLSPCGHFSRLWLHPLAHTHNLRLLVHTYSAVVWTY